jgi:hypothetical protein
MAAAKRTTQLPTLAVLTERVSSIDERVTSLATTQASVAESLKSLVRLEERFSNSIAQQAEHNKMLMANSTRLGNIETQIPSLKEARVWFISGCAGILGLVGMTFWSTFVTVPQHKQPVEIVQPAAK